MDTSTNVVPAPVLVLADAVVLRGDLCVPEGARALVLFAHGSGSSRSSPRNLRVAELLQHAGFATLRFDLLTEREQVFDAQTSEFRFDIPRLVRRLVGATDWARARAGLTALRLGYFGASTGGAAALGAAAERPDVVGAVVLRGGRPDLAGEALARVRAPTRLIVGAYDHTVGEMNRRALEAMSCARDMVVVPRAGHLFEEPGAMKQVAFAANEWFCRYLLA